MGIEIEKVSGNSTAQDLLTITRLNAEVKKTEATKKTEQENEINGANPLKRKRNGS